MEDNMQAVGGILGNLKNMATDMGAEIEKQNSQLDRINDKVIFFFSFTHSMIIYQLYYFIFYFVISRERLMGGVLALGTLRKGSLIELKANNKQLLVKLWFYF